MSEYAKHIQTIEDMWKKRIELREEGCGRMSELKPCPFCGGEAKVAIGQGQHDGHGYIVFCNRCWVSQSYLDKTEAEAIEAWNSRAERTCKVIMEQHNDYGYQTQVDDYTFSLSCGHVVTWDDLPDYCPCCGAKVVGE